MWLEVENLQTTVTNATDDERGWLQEYLAFDDPGAAYRTYNRSDGKFRMYNVFSAQFPSGFVPLVEKAAKAEGFQTQRLDKRKCPRPIDTTADLGWLRDYQLAAVQAVHRNTRGILHVPTGGGKTELAVACVLSCPVRWLFVVHRTTLADQARERFTLRTGMRAGFIGDGQWDLHDDGMLVCATFQTLARGLEKKDERVLSLLASVGGVLVDESHTLPAASFYRVVMALDGAYWRVGLSGTPLARGDKRSVLSIAALGPVIYRLPTEKLIQEGVLAKPTIRVVPVTQLIDRPTWQGAYGEGVVRSALRNRVVVDCARRAEKPALVFVKEISHGKGLVRALERAGLKVAFVWGSSFEDQRKRAIRDLEAGRLDVVVCSVVFQEGVDIPSLRSVVIGSGGKSVIAALQRIGRGMRRTDDKTTFEVWDIKDEGCGCNGKTHSGCRWLRAHANARVRAYVKEGHSVVTESAVTAQLALPSASR